MVREVIPFLFLKLDRRIFMNSDSVHKIMARGSSRFWYPSLDYLREYDDSSDRADEKLIEARENDFKFRKKMASRPRRKKR